MRYLLLFFLLCICFPTFAGKHKDKRGLPRTEVGLMNNVLGCLSNKDSVNYFNLFPPFDSLWQLVIHNPNHSPEATAQLNKLKEHPRALIEFDPAYNHSIMTRFNDLLRKGEDSGIHWKEIVMQRYELSREVITSRTQTGYDIIVPERYKGYVFVRDVLGRLTFCISITEIQKINGYFFGGQVLNILEASSIDQFLQKEAEEQKYYEWLVMNAQLDTARADSVQKGLLDTTSKDTLNPGKKPDNLNVEPVEEDTFRKRREIVDRRYYEGKFDEEIPVKLYVRYMRDLRTNKITGYDGLYKFGDQVQYAKLNITRSPEGIWTMDDDPPIGTMELELKYKVYTGSWTNNENQTGYDVVLTQKDIPSITLAKLDRILETGLVGRVDDETGPVKPAEPIIEGMENQPDPEAAKTPPPVIKKKKKKEADPEDEEPQPKKKKVKKEDENE